MSAKNRITINLDDKNYDELTVLSEKLDVSLAWLGRRAFSDLLVKYTGKQEDMLTIVASTKQSLSQS